jgi:hypothetical protein
MIAILAWQRLREPYPSFSSNSRVIVSRGVTTDAQTRGAVSSAKRRARLLRITAAVVLVLGIFGADLVYWLGTRSAEASDDPSTLGNEKAESRQAEILYGKQAGLIKEWAEDLNRPGTQAVIIVVAAALVAGGCFFFARLFDTGSERGE